MNPVVQAGQHASITANRPIKIDVTHCNYPVVIEAAKALRWECVDGDCKVWDVKWVESGIGIERIVQQMRSNQRVNHYCGMEEIYRKDRLTRSLTKMQRFYPIEYDFFPQTWQLPGELAAACAYLQQPATLIIKPCASSQVNAGLFYIRDCSQ